MNRYVLRAALIFICVLVLVGIVQAVSALAHWATGALN